MANAIVVRDAGSTLSSLRRLFSLRDITASTPGRLKRLADAAFQFPLRHSTVVSVISGGQGLEVMQSNMRAADAVFAGDLAQKEHGGRTLRPRLSEHRAVAQADRKWCTKEIQKE